MTREEYDKALTCRKCKGKLELYVAVPILIGGAFGIEITSERCEKCGWQQASCFRADEVEWVDGMFLAVEKDWVSNLVAATLFYGAGMDDLGSWMLSDHYQQSLIEQHFIDE